MMTEKMVKFTITSKEQKAIEINPENNSISVPACELIGLDSITAYMDAMQRAATLLALGKEAKENDD